MKEIEIKLHKDWKNPQQYIVQLFSFDEIKSIEKENNELVLSLHNNKTGFIANVKLSSLIVKQIVKIHNSG